MDAEGNPIIGSERIEQALKEAGMRKGQSLLIHSFLGAFGNLPEGCEGVLKALQAAVGPEGTLIFPTYNYDFCKGVPYDHDQSPSQVGQLTEFVRKKEEAARVLHPVYSHAVIGFKQKEYCSHPSTSGFGKGTLFEKLKLDPEGHILFFGVDWNSATFIHHVEETLQAPYRFHKVFRGKVMHDGLTEDYEAVIFSRYLELNPMLDLRPFQKWMLDANFARKSILGRGVLSLVKAVDFFDKASANYRKNLFYFLKEPVDLSKRGMHV